MQSQKVSSKIITGDCVEELAKLEEASIDSIVCDPPYGLKFMGKQFDDLGEGAQQREWHKRWAQEALRVLKPGGHLLAFGGTRTYHHLATAIEDAGFEIRDQMQWLYGSGFPKSLNVGKAMDRKRDDKKEIYQVTAWIREARNKAGISNKKIDDAFGANGMGRHWTDVPPNGKQPSVPTLDQVPKLLEVLGVDPDEVPADIKRLLYELNGRKGQPGENWAKREVIGTGKSAIANKEEGVRHTVGASQAVEFDLTAPATDAAKQWEGWGTALKPANEPIVVARKPFKGTVAENVQEHGTGALNIDGTRVGTEQWTRTDNCGPYSSKRTWSTSNTPGRRRTQEGRWPANVILDEEAGALLDEQSGTLKSGKPSGKRGTSDHNVSYADAATGSDLTGYGDQGGASRFFYCAKAAKKERNAGYEGNNHPTVKPISLMRYLCRLVTPPGGTVLDPFLGSGTTGCAAALEGFNFIGIEMDKEYVKIARARIKHWQKEAKKQAKKKD